MLDFEPAMARDLKSAIYNQQSTILQLSSYRVLNFVLKRCYKPRKGLIRPHHMLSLVLVAALPCALNAQDVLPAVRFADDPGNYYVPIRAAANALGLNIRLDKDRVLLDDLPVTDTRDLFDGT